jgi:hypothetical protein
VRAEGVEEYCAQQLTDDAGKAEDEYSEPVDDGGRDGDHTDADEATAVQPGFAREFARWAAAEDQLDREREAECAPRDHEVDECGCPGRAGYSANASVQSGLYGKGEPRYYGESEQPQRAFAGRLASTGDGDGGDTGGRADYPGRRDCPGSAGAESGAIHGQAAGRRTADYCHDEHPYTERTDADALADHIQGTRDAAKALPPTEALHSQGLSDLPESPLADARRRNDRKEHEDPAAGRDHRRHDPITKARPKPAVEPSLQRQPDATNSRQRDNR